MNHPRDVRAGRVLGRPECIFRQHMLEFDCLIEKKGDFRSECSGHAVSPTTGSALHCQPSHSSTGRRIRSGCAAQPLLDSPITEDHTGSPSPACLHESLYPLLGNHCMGMHMPTGLAPHLLLAPDSSHGSCCTWSQSLGHLQERGCLWGHQHPKLHL